MQLIDTHTHLDFEMFDDDRAQVIARARNAGVERIVVLGVHAANWQHLDHTGTIWRRLAVGTPAFKRGG